MKQVSTIGQGIRVTGKKEPRAADVLSPAALTFLEGLHRAFHTRRAELLAARADRQARLRAGERPDFLGATKSVREGTWKVAAVPKDLQDRRVEITGPVERKMMINAFNSGARVFMADFEDANSPTWSNVVAGQANLLDHVDGKLAFTSTEGKEYKVNAKPATLCVRPRGWHLEEKHVLVDGKPMSASLVDFGLFFFHCAKKLIAKGSGPYFYLPKIESHLEARLWNDVFLHAQDSLKIPKGTVKATVLIETILAAFEMDEILYELKDHAAGLNAGRWDYIFSIIKKFRDDPKMVLPDRIQVTMTVPFMRAYTELLVQTCHKRGAHAMGGMSAFVPNRKDAAVTEGALKKVREDKERESKDGFDGTWVAHPDLVPVATAVFDALLGAKPNQVDRQRPEVKVVAKDLLDVTIPGSSVTENGVRGNVNVGLQYIESWLRGTGAAALHNLMEDAATAEIARSQIWQWIRHNVKLTDGRVVSKVFVQRTMDEELKYLETEIGAQKFKAGRFADARKVFEAVALANEMPEFLTITAYDHID